MLDASLLTDTFTDSAALYDMARNYLPGGVTGPGRKADPDIGHPFYVQRGQGSSAEAGSSLVPVENVEAEPPTPEPFRVLFLDQDQGVQAVNGRPTTDVQ